MLNNISADRGIPVEKLNSIADNLTGYVAQGAFESGLVDGLLYHDQLIDTLKVRSGLTPDDKIALVPMHKYTKVPESKKTPFQKNKISVVYASGSIVNGKGNENNIGGDAFRDVIRKERKDSTVKLSYSGSTAAGEVPLHLT